jgi:osmotically-inducible protein OsmY
MAAARDRSEEQPDQYVLEHVREAIAQDERLGELHVHVTRVGDRIVITGDVATEERRRTLAEVVGRVCPGCEVANQASVEPLPEAPKVERLS